MNSRLVYTYVLQLHNNITIINAFEFEIYSTTYH